MPRYCRQRDGISCGPIALINAAKWAGLSEISIKSHLPFFQFSMQTIDLAKDHPDYHGTTDFDFCRVLRYVTKGILKVRRKKNPTFNELKNHLTQGGAVVLSYHWEESNQVGDHFCFIESIQNGLFKTANDHDSANQGTVGLRTDKTIKRWLIKAPDSPYAWFLTKLT